MDTNKSVTANFVFDGYIIYASAGMGGTILPSGPTLVFAGATQVFSMAAAEWYVIAVVTVDGVSTGAVSSVTFANVVTNHTIGASFSPLLASRGTPLWWLAQYGWTNNFDVAESGDPDGDGVATWLEYLGGTNPTNPLSRSVYNTVPYEESFEALAGWGSGYTNVFGHMGWTSSKPEYDGSRITNLVYVFSATNLPLVSVTHTNVLRLNTQGAILTNSFGDGFDLGSSVAYVDVMAQFMTAERPPACYTIADTGIKGGVCANASSNLAVYHGVAASDGTLLSNTVEATTLPLNLTNWYRVTLTIDATTTNPAHSLAMFQVALNGVCVTNADAYTDGWKSQFEATGTLPPTDGAGTWFRLATTNNVTKKLKAVCFTGDGYLDDMVVSTVNPFGLGGTYLVIVTKNGNGVSSLGAGPYATAQVAAGVTTQIVYIADEWNRVFSWRPTV